MTSGALHRYRLVKQNIFSRNRSKRFVAKLTFHPSVTTLQGKLRSFVVIEKRGYPPLLVVAICARRDSRFGTELPTVRVDVAVLAFPRSAFELNLLRAWERFVTRAAAHRTVHT